MAAGGVVAEPTRRRMDRRRRPWRRERGRASFRRLPTEPLVVEPTDRIGVYGGQWRTIVSGPANTWWLDRTIGAEHLLTWYSDFAEVLPNNRYRGRDQRHGDHLHHLAPERIRWSDGELFTADDLVFAYESVLTHPDLFPVTPAWLCDGGKAGNPPGCCEKLDDYTVRVQLRRTEWHLPAVDFLSGCAAAGRPPSALPDAVPPGLQFRCSGRCRSRRVLRLETVLL